MGQRHKLYGQLEVDGQVQVAGAVNVGGALVVTDETTTTLASGTTGSLVYYNESTSQLTYGGPPPALEKELRHEFVSPYSYVGKADAGSVDSDATWTISRIEILDDGGTVVTSATNVNWTNRYTHTYS